MRRQAYEAINGHIAVKGTIIEDIEMGRNIRRKRLKSIFMDGTDIATVRMYSSLREIMNGLGKVMGPIFEFKILPTLVLLAILCIILISPYVFIIVKLATLTFDVAFFMALGAAASAYISWTAMTVRLKYPFYNVLLYPITLISTVYLILRSIVAGLLGKVHWKGRATKQSQWKWM